MNNYRTETGKDFVEIIVDQFEHIEDQGIVLDEENVLSLLLKLRRLQQGMSTQEQDLLTQVIRMPV